MKPTAIGSVLALVLVPSILGKPTRTAEDPPSKRSSLPAVSVSGNGELALQERRRPAGIGEWLH